MVREETKQPFPAFVLPTFCFVRAPRDWEGRRGGGGDGVAVTSLPEKFTQCPMIVEIGLQTHSNCMKTKNVLNSQHLMKLLCFQK